MAENHHTPPDNPVERSLARLDLELVEPTRTGIRKVIGSMGTVAASALMVVGLAIGLFGGMVALLTTLPFLQNLGALIAASGIVPFTLGALSLWFVRRSTGQAQQASVSRQLLKLSALHPGIRDQAVATRLGIPVETVREKAAALESQGALSVEFDSQTGEDRYRLVTPLALEQMGVELSPEEAESLRRFERELQEQGAGSAAQTGPAPEVQVEAEVVVESDDAS